MASPMHGKKRNNRNESPMGWIGRGFCQDSVQAHKGNKGYSASPRAHALHILEISMNMQQNETRLEWQKWHGSKRRQTHRIAEFTQGPEHHLLIPSQYRRGGPSVKGFRGCGLVVGRKERSILELMSRLLLGKMPCWDDISPKRGK